MARRSTNLFLAALLAPITLIAAAAVPADTHADSVEIASQIVQQLQTLGHHRAQSPGARSAVSLQALPSSLHYETAAYYEEPDFHHEYYKLHAEPEESSSLTPTGIDPNAALGYISYLILLVLLESAVEGVAARAPSHRRRRNASWPKEDLVGRAGTPVSDLPSHVTDDEWKQRTGSWLREDLPKDIEDSKTASYDTRSRGQRPDSWTERDRDGPEDVRGRQRDTRHRLRLRDRYHRDLQD